MVRAGYLIRQDGGQELLGRASSLAGNSLMTAAAAAAAAAAGAVFFSSLSKKSQLHHLIFSIPTDGSSDHGSSSGSLTA